MPHPIHPLALATLAATAHAQVGGLYLPEHGGPATGTAMAGQAAIARDAQTAWLNPAGMTRLESAEVMVTVMPFYTDLSFSSSPATTLPGNDGGQQGGWLPKGAIFLALPIIDDRLAFGFSVTAPAGTILDPSDNWVGRSYMTETTLIALNLEPSLGFRVVDTLSLGVGLDVQYADFEQKLGLPDPGGPLPVGGGEVKVDGDSWQVGVSASLLWEPLEQLRFGVRYRSPMNHELDGDFRVLGTRSASTGLDLPQSVTASAYWEINDVVAVMADFGWTDWGAFSSTVINTDAIDANIPRNWDDVWHGGLGVHVRPADRWLLMAGFAYTSSAVEDRFRTPDLPIDRQVRVSVGLEYAVTETITVGGNFTYIDLGRNRIDQTRGPARIAGSYDADLYMIGLYASFKF
jgi:long-chain fatty acid transport protein